MIQFKNEQGKVLVSYDNYLSVQEIKATRELLEHENNCTITAVIDKEFMEQSTTEKMIEKMLDIECSNKEIIEFITNSYFLKGHSLTDFENDLIYTHKLTETAAENLLDDVKEVFAKANQGKELIQKCNKCKSVFKITIIESDKIEPLSYTLQCPCCGASGIYDIEQV